MTGDDRRASMLTQPLRTGDPVHVAATSSAVESLQPVNDGLAVLRRWGLSVPGPEPVLRRWGYLAGSDQQRRSDLSVPQDGQQGRLIACARGGWGAARLLEESIPWTPGWLMGFSDVTSLLWARLAAGWSGGIHGPLLTTLALEPSWSQERLRRILFGDAVPDLNGIALGGGRVCGPVIAGNLTVASHLIGSPHLPNLKGAILVLEDVGEAPYRIDRMLTHWRLSGLLQQVGGIAFGQFSGCDDDERDDSERFSLQDVLLERTKDLQVPRVIDLPVGHVCGNAALPMGAKAVLDGESGRLSLLT